MDHKTDTDRGREALDRYLKDCDTHAIVPDVGGAFHAAFMAGRASLPLPGAQEAVATVFTMEALTPGAGVKYHATIHKPLPAGTKLYAAPQPALSAEKELRKVLAAVQRYMPPDGPSAKDTLSEIISIVDPWPLGRMEKS